MKPIDGLSPGRPVRAPRSLAGKPLAEFVLREADVFKSYMA